MVGLGKNPSRNGWWFRGTPISGNPHYEMMSFWICFCLQICLVCFCFFTFLNGVVWICLLSVQRISWTLDWWILWWISWSGMSSGDFDSISCLVTLPVVGRDLLLSSLSRWWVYFWYCFHGFLGLGLWNWWILDVGAQKIRQMGNVGWCWPVFSTEHHIY